MAEHKKEITLTDLQQKILSNDLYNDTDNAGLDAWIQDAVDGKINLAGNINNPQNKHSVLLPTCMTPPRVITSRDTFAFCFVVIGFTPVFVCVRVR